MYFVVLVAIQMCVAVKLYGYIYFLRFLIIYLNDNIFVQFLSKKEVKHKTYTSDVAEFNMVMEVFGFSNLAH